MPTQQLYFEYIQDPSTGNLIEVRDKYAREQLVYKIEKQIVDSLPAKPTSYAEWVTMQKFVYYLPVDGKPNEYEAWTLFFTGDPENPSDYTDTNNYQWMEIASTESDLDNFSLKGHTHEVIPEVEVADHSYTPQGLVTSTFDGSTGYTSEYQHSHNFKPAGTIDASFTGSSNQKTSTETHNHRFTPSGNVTGTFTGTPNQSTGSSNSGVSINATKKKLDTRNIHIEDASLLIDASMYSVSTGILDDQSNYDASTSIINGISLDDGVLSFVIRKMHKENVVRSLTSSTNASKVLYNNSGTIDASVATGSLLNDTNGPILGSESSITDNGHSHTFTAEGSLDLTFQGSTGNTEDSSHYHTYTAAGSVSALFTGTDSSTSIDTHSHTYTPSGLIDSSFNGTASTLVHQVTPHKVRTGPDENEDSMAFGWYGILYPENEENPSKLRIGNMDMHRILPIQSKMRRCLVKDDGFVYNYLDPNDSTKYAQGSKDLEGNDISGMEAELTGTAFSEYGNISSSAFNVQVMVEIPEHWRRVYLYDDNGTIMVKAMLSPYLQETTGWVHVKKGYISAYEAHYDTVSNLLCSISFIKDLSIDIDPITGETVIHSDLDTASTGSDILSILPSTYMGLDELRDAARHRSTGNEWNALVYDQYIALYWLYAIEYANLNSQDEFNENLTQEGFHQGGLGIGATTIENLKWNSFNSSTPFIPCGVTNCLGNQSGIVKIKLPSALSLVDTMYVNSYRGIELPFGHISKLVDGVVYYMDDSTNNRYLYRCDDPANYGTLNDYTQTIIGTGTSSLNMEGYITKIVIGNDGDISCKSVTSGASNKAYCDYVNEGSHNTYYNYSFGGHAASDSQAGMTCTNINTLSETGKSSQYGTRLCYFVK